MELYLLLPVIGCQGPGWWCGGYHQPEAWESQVGGDGMKVMVAPAGLWKSWAIALMGLYLLCLAAPARIGKIDVLRGLDCGMPAIARPEVLNVLQPLAEVLMITRDIEISRNAFRGGRRCEEGEIRIRGRIVIEGFAPDHATALKVKRDACTSKQRLFIDKQCISGWGKCKTQQQAACECISVNEPTEPVILRHRRHGTRARSRYLGPF
ncbi:hypothetical protein BDP81DRAFT_14341 [Colletotrichum phormii]|uniref:Uncharacterized protein n=1 Tax=Colletotrichum phormii TaxID=359342 RepID=A0AAJ0A3Z1_9PEZI|nr:uncharacterized protein BDP81DRAFT_14341 [Colletotrichum phormii]KAK1656045.1 hypothetical protein BDP81DRAFT_14341 [Colletotrichum phormii]